MVPYHIEMLDNFGRWQHLSLRDGWAQFSNLNAARVCVAIQVTRGWKLEALRIVDAKGRVFW